jgi:hypothetical protein
VLTTTRRLCRPDSHLGNGRYRLELFSDLTRSPQLVPVNACVIVTNYVRIVNAYASRSYMPAHLSGVGSTLTSPESCPYIFLVRQGWLCCHSARVRVAQHYLRD